MDNSHRPPSSLIIEESLEPETLSATTSNQSTHDTDLGIGSQAETSITDVVSNAEIGWMEETSKAVTKFTTSESPVSPTAEILKSAILENITEVPATDDPEASYFGFYAWMTEIFFCVLSLSSLIVITTVLRAYDGKALPNLPMSITLNTFLAFFTTLTKATFMLSVAEAISQWKWNMLKNKERPLTDFLAVDSASRGMWGSFWIMGRFRMNHVAILGAVISLLGMATSPVTQQMIAYPLRLAQVEGIATVPTSSHFEDNNGFNVWHAIFAGVISTFDDPILPVSPVCSTPDCTFPQYKSIGMCAKAVNITSLLNVEVIPNSNADDWPYPAWTGMIAQNGSTAMNASLPNGISWVTPASVSYMAMPSNKTMAFANDTNMAFTAFEYMVLIWSNAGNITNFESNLTSQTPWKFEAVEVAIYLCLNTYETEMSQSQPSTNIVKSSYVPANVPNNVGNFLAGCWFEKFPGTPFGTQKFCDTGLYVDGNMTLVDPDDPSTTYSADAKALHSIDINLQEADLATFVSNGNMDPGIYATDTQSLALANVIYNDYENDLLLDPAEQFERVGTFYNSTANSLTNLMRTSSSTTVNGTAWKDETFVEIKWGWLVFLASQLVLSIIFLLITVISTYRMRIPAMKSSALAMLLAPAEEIRDKIGDIGHFEEATKRSGGMKVRLINNGLVVSPGRFQADDNA
ncbi:uncharacterized protein LY89DRAFT_725615 [Mollisia scopiformis]|uniref:Uncharacterized protein n=1 Tax=Mollisia scopiformis TaxID=149040 RepID=A0A132B668_MOLSC|nr:uncharacterized protein LY89DRAFT_725615 [Mollisia scopiformis]KUJ07908.1 hypothetical protein LY89DRAFT_725615 [Mollisia scopiformis]